MSDLKEYYEQRMLSQYPEMPPFEELNDEQQILLLKSFSFAGYRLDKATNQLSVTLSDAIKKMIDSNCKFFKRLINQINKAPLPSK